MRQQKKAIVRLIFPVFLVMVLFYGPNLFSQEMKADTISIEKKEFEPGNDIRIEYRCSEDNLPYLWIGIFKADIDDQMMKDAGLSIKILGELNSSVLLNAPDTPGNYQVRLFSLQSGNVSVHHRLNIEVKEKDDFKNKPDTLKDEIDKNIKVTEKKDLIVDETLSNNKGSSVSSTSGAIFKPGEDVILVEKTIGSEGGTIEAPSDSPLNGAKVVFPTGALPKNNTIKLGYNTGTLSGLSIGNSKTFLVLKPSNTTYFDRPVNITMPLCKKKEFGVPYYITSNGSLQLMQIVNMNLKKKTITFQTPHASLFTLIYIGLARILGIKGFDTSFNPEVDGFGIKNFDTKRYKSGVCFAFPAFAKYYFEYQKKIKGVGLADYFKADYFNEKCRKANDKELDEMQETIAECTFTALNQKKPLSKKKKLMFYYVIPDQQIFCTIVLSLAVTKKPVVLWLGSVQDFDTAKTYQHIVLAYAYKNGEISIYDPNSPPGKTDTIKYDHFIDSFVSYKGYSGFGYFADEDVILKDKFEKIFNDVTNCQMSSKFSNYNCMAVFFSGSVNVKKYPHGQKPSQLYRGDVFIESSCCTDTERMLVKPLEIRWTGNTFHATTTTTFFVTYNYTYDGKISDDGNTQEYLKLEKVRKWVSPEKLIKEVIKKVILKNIPFNKSMNRFEIKDASELIKEITYLERQTGAEYTENNYEIKNVKEGDYQMKTFYLSFYRSK